MVTETAISIPVSFADGIDTPTNLEEQLENTANPQTVENSGCESFAAQIAYNSHEYTPPLPSSRVTGPGPLAGDSQAKESIMDGKESEAAKRVGPDKQHQVTGNGGCGGCYLRCGCLTSLGVGGGQEGAARRQSAERGRW